MSVKGELRYQARKLGITLAALKARIRRSVGMRAEREHRIKDAYMQWQRNHPGAVSYQAFKRGYLGRKARTKRMNAMTADERREYGRAQYSQWVQTSKRVDPLRHLLRSAKARAKKRKMAFRISAVDLMAGGELPERCPVLGIKLYYGAGRGRGFHRGARR